MAKIIVVRGKGSIGKSASIVMARDMLLKKYPDAKYELEVNRRSVDILVVIIVNGIKIGIESRGDTEELLKAGLKILMKHKCDVIVCATRTGGKTVRIIEALEKNHEVCWIVKKPESNPDAYKEANRRVAMKILSEIESTIL